MIFFFIFCFKKYFFVFLVFCKLVKKYLVVFILILYKSFFFKEILLFFCFDVCNGMLILFVKYFVVFRKVSFLYFIINVIIFFVFL